MRCLDYRLLCVLVTELTVVRCESSLKPHCSTNICICNVLSKDDTVLYWTISIPTCGRKSYHPVEFPLIVTIWNRARAHGETYGYMETSWGHATTALVSLVDVTTSIIFTKSIKLYSFRYPNETLIISS